MINFDTSPQPSSDDQRINSSKSEMEINKLEQHTTSDKKTHSLQTAVTDLSTLALALLLIFLIISLLSFSMSDPAWSRTTSEITEVHNIMGEIGAYSADVLYYLFGLSTWWINFFLAFSIFNLLLKHHLPNAEEKISFSFTYSFIGLITTLITSTTLEQSFLTETLKQRLPLGAGGLIGSTLSTMFHSFLNDSFVKILFTILLIKGLLLIIQTSWIYLFQTTKVFVLNIFNHQDEQPKDEQERTLLKAQSINQKPVEKPNVATSNREIKSKQTNNQVFNKKTKPLTVVLPHIEPIQNREIPVLSLLKKPFKKIYPHRKEVERNTLKQSAIISETFSQNNVANRLIKANIGPTFVNYHIQLNLPINSQEVQQSCTELKHRFNNDHVFLSQPSPTLADYELLITRKKPENVSLMEIFSKNTFSNSNQNLIIALGKDTHHRAIFTSLENMPNLLISGNNHDEIVLGLKAVMSSLIARYTSKHLKMILVGENRATFDNYLTLPHLISPLINSEDSALSMFSWSLAENKKRLEILKHTQSQNIDKLNQKLYDASDKNILIADPFSEDLDNPSPLSPLPLLVIIIDQIDWLKYVLALIGKNQFLELTRYSREIGIHWVLAQSSPSKILINQAIKYSFPTRLSFQVDNYIESLLILNHRGAENLIGKGDALLLSSHNSRPIRLQIGTLTQKEYSELVGNFRSEQVFDENIINFQAKKTTNRFNQDLYDTAVQHVLNSHKTSISFLQRKMKIGYNLANQLLEQMEDNGILSKAELGGTRKILMSQPHQQHKDQKWL